MNLTSTFTIFSDKVKRKAQGALKYDYLVPNGAYEEQWDWDGFFMGLAFILHDPKEGIWLKNWALNFIINSREDGYTPGCITFQGRDERLNQMKPFLAQGVYQASVALHDFSWITPYYQALKNIVMYREKFLWNTKYDLGVWFNSMESGADNNVAALNFPDKTVIATDLNTYLYCEYKSMAKIAHNLHNTKDYTFFKQRAQQIKQNINKYMWDKNLSAYFNIDSRDDTFIRHVSFNSFHPLWAHIVPKSRANLFIRKYALNSKQLLSTYGIRTLSKQDTEYNNVNMIKPYSNWQGPVWPIANYFYIYSLLNYGFIKEARLVAEKITKLCLNDIKISGGMHENYSAETGEPLAAPNFISWNLLVPHLLEATKIIN